MNKKDIKNAQLGAKTLQGFCSQFGDDVYSQILLEEIFKGLIDNEIVFIFGQQKQTGDQIDYHSSDTKINNNETDGTQ